MFAANPRMTGIVAIAYFVVAIVGAFVLSSGVGNQVLTAILALLMIYIYMTFRAWLESKGFTAVSMLILIVVVLNVVNAVLQIIGFGVATGGQQASGGATGAMIWAIVLVLLQIAQLLLGIKILPFGNIGGGIWKAYGILLIIAAGISLVGGAILLIGALGPDIGMILTGVGIVGIGALVYLAVWIIFIIGMFKAS
jgi:hypothetical protein